MKHYTSINIAIGGFIVKTRCPDPALAQRIQSSFHCSAGRRKPLLTLTVYPASPGSPVAPGLRSQKHCFGGVGCPAACRGELHSPAPAPRLPSPERSAQAGKGFELPAGKIPRNFCQILDGEEEYRAAFDPAGRRALVRLTGPDPARALANFIRRIFTRLIIDRCGAVFHCACVVRHSPGFRRRSKSYGGQVAGGCAEARAAYLFFGKSGAGKSTVCGLSQNDAIAGRAFTRRSRLRVAWLRRSEIARRRVAGDDLTAVRAVKGRLLAWGLPSFNDTPRICLSDGPFPIKAAFTLVKDKRIHVKRLGAATALAGMLAFPADLSDPERIGKIVDLLSRLVQNVPCRKLHFRKDRVFWDVIDAELD